MTEAPLPAKSDNKTQTRSFPALPKPPPPPNRAALDTKIARTREEMTAFRARLSTLSERLRALESDEERRSFYERQQEYNGEIRHLQALMQREREKYYELSKATQETRQLRADLRSKLQKLTGELDAFKNVEDIHSAIAHMEQKLETEGHGSLKQEKEFLRRRKMLESAKEQLKEVEPLKEQISQCGDKEIENLRESREISKRIEEHKAKLNEAKAARDALSAPTGAWKEVKELRSKRDKLRTQMNEAYKAMQDLREEFKKEEEEYRSKREAWMTELEAIKAERDKLRQQRSEDRAKKNEQDEALHMNEKERHLCNSLIYYLEDKLSIGKAHRKPQETNRPSTAVSEDTSPNGESDWLFSNRRKKSSGGKVTKSQQGKDAPLRIDLHRIVSFEQLKMDYPRTTSQAQEVLVVLKEKVIKCKIEQEAASSTDYKLEETSSSHSD